MFEHTEIDLTATNFIDKATWNEGPWMHEPESRGVALSRNAMSDRA